MLNINIVNDVNIFFVKNYLIETYF